MKFFIYIHKTALNVAIDKENIEIVKTLLSYPKIDVNIVIILFSFSQYSRLTFLIIFKINFLNVITKNVF